MSSATITPPVSAPATTVTPTSGSPAATTESHASTENTNETPKSLNIDYGDGNTETLSLDDSANPADAEKPFAFADLEPIKDSHQDLYKNLKKPLSQLDRYSKAFKSPEEARAHLDRLDKLVKLTGIQDKTGLDAVEHSLGTLANTLQSVQNGDKATVERWFKDNPTGMSQLATEVLSQWAKADANSWSAAHAKVAFDTLSQKDSYGQSAVDALNALYDHVKASPDALKLLQRVAHTVNTIHAAASYKPDQSAVISQKEAALKKQAADLWNKETDLQVMPIVQTAAKKGLSAVVSQFKRNISSEERSEFVDQLTQDFYKAAGSDQDFTRRLNELRNNNDRDGILNLVKSVRTKHMNAALKNLIKTKLLDRQAIRDEASSQQEAAGGSSTGSSKGTTQYTGRMKYGAPDVQYDYQRMKAEDPNMLENHQFYIVGRKERFRW